MIPDTVPTDSTATVTITGPLVHQCPHVEETDEGTITLRWVCVGATLELHSLARYLEAWEDAELSHEDVTARINHDLGVIPGIALLDVTTTWTTAGLTVTCST